MTNDTNREDVTQIAQDPRDDIIRELCEALEWMIDNDETNEGDEPLSDHGGRTWNEINEYWIGGLNRARGALRRARKQG